jgi:hypothetical protein
VYLLLWTLPYVVNYLSSYKHRDNYLNHNSASIFSCKIYARGRSRISGYQLCEDKYPCYIFLGKVNPQEDQDPCSILLAILNHGKTRILALFFLQHWIHGKTRILTQFCLQHTYGKTRILTLFFLQHRISGKIRILSLSKLIRSMILMMC